MSIFGYFDYLSSFMLDQLFSSLEEKKCLLSNQFGLNRNGMLHFNFQCTTSLTSHMKPLPFLLIYRITVTTPLNWQIYPAYWFSVVTLLRLLFNSNSQKAKHHSFLFSYDKDGRKKKPFNA